MIGIDVVAVERIAKAVENETFLRRVFTDGERDYYAKNGKIESLAGFFAAKEAFMKAFGKGIDLGALGEIEVEHDLNGAPRLALSGGAAELAAGKTVCVSISHDGGVAVAAVEAI